MVLRISHIDVQIISPLVTFASLALGQFGAASLCEVFSMPKQKCGFLRFERYAISAACVTALTAGCAQSLASALHLCRLQLRTT